MKGMAMRQCMHLNTKVVTRKETFTFDETDITIESKFRVCKDCGEDIWDATLDHENYEAAQRIYRNRK